MIPKLETPDNPDWFAQDHSYAGWVPNVSGQLSFSIIGTNTTAHDAIAFNAPSQDHSKRYIAIHQKRWTTDYPLLRPWLLCWLIPKAGVNYIMIAETANAAIPIVDTNQAAKDSDVKCLQNAHGVLLGTIFIVPRDKDEQKRKVVDSFIENVRVDCRR